MKTDTLPAYAIPKLDVATRLREFPIPPRRVLIEGAGEIERLRRDLVKAQARIAELEGRP